MTVKIGKDGRHLHGLSKTRLYRIWAGMKTRCSNKNRLAFADYGARGISVCDEWETFEPFREWALRSGYEDNLTIERKDTNIGYCPENCKWIPRGDQNKNTRRNILITFNGETMIVSDWARKIGLPVGRLSHRLRSGWSVERALTTPLRKCERRNK